MILFAQRSEYREAVAVMAKFTPTTIRILIYDTMGRVIGENSTDDILGVVRDGRPIVAVDEKHRGFDDSQDGKCSVVLMAVRAVGVHDWRRKVCNWRNTSAKVGTDTPCPII